LEAEIRVLRHELNVLQQRTNWQTEVAATPGSLIMDCR
jgi:hypothetical protein